MGMGWRRLRLRRGHRWLLATGYWLLVIEFDELRLVYLCGGLKSKALKREDR